MMILASQANQEEVVVEEDVRVANVEKPADR